MRFDNKVVVITGGGQGMGRASALAFAREGANLILNTLTEKSMNNIVEEIRSIGGTVTPVQGDVTKNDLARVIIDKALEQYGRVDILFNYVGGSPDLSPFTLFHEQTEESVDRTIELNLKSTILMCRAVMETMIKQKKGKIINLGSTSGRVGAELMVVYSGAKGGVIGFTKALAKEVAIHNINVNCICPGPIDTPGFNKIFSEEQRKAVMESVPLKRLGRPEEIAGAVLFLASDDADFITGQILTVDGGMTMV